MDLSRLKAHVTSLRTCDADARDALKREIDALMASIMARIIPIFPRDGAHEIRVLARELSTFMPMTYKQQYLETMQLTRE